VPQLFLYKIYYFQAQLSLFSYFFPFQKNIISYVTASLIYHNSFALSKKINPNLIAAFIEAFLA